MYIRGLTWLAVAIGLVTLPAVADAGDHKHKREKKGIAERLHTVSPKGKRVCMTKHMHYGVSDWNVDRKVSHKEAVNSWSVFTRMEYGARWSNFRMANDSRVHCTQNAHRQWKCDAEGRPCRKR